MLPHHFTMFFLLFFRFLPVIAMSEVKAAHPGAHDVPGQTATDSLAARQDALLPVRHAAQLAG